MTDRDRLQAAITGALLEQGRSIDGFATGIGLIAAACALSGWIAVPSWVLAALIALALAQKYVAVRVAFDAALFGRCGVGTITTDDFDAALRSLGLLPSGKAGRSWQDRCRGGRRLLAVQAMLALAQGCAVVVASLG